MKKGFALLMVFLLLLAGGCGNEGSSPGREAPATQHQYPEALAVFEAIADGQPEVDLSAAAELRIYVNHCEYGEPEQYITDPTVVSAVAERLAAMTVTGRHDQISSTGTYIAYNVCGQDGGVLAGFAFQDGLLMAADGRYDVTGLDELLAVEGVMQPEDWSDYWQTLDAAETEYESSFTETLPATVFALRGSVAQRFYENFDELTVTGVRIDGGNGQNKNDVFSADDPAVIRAVFDALADVQAVAPADSPTGYGFDVRFFYKEPGQSFENSFYLAFCDGCFVCDRGAYKTEGLAKLFDATEDDALAALGSAAGL